MTWFQGECPSASEMQDELNRYLDAANTTKKHIPRTQLLLGTWWLASRKRPFKDRWPELDELKDVSAQGTITGTAIKYAFRSRVLQLQDGRCCYCRRWLVNTAHAKPIEHILPRSEYPQFSFEFWNLAVACRDCNQIKADDVWGSIPIRRRKYPRASEFGEFFHPRFHRYDEHVWYARTEITSSAIVVFGGITPQGRHLCRTLLHKIAAKETIVKNNSALAPAVEQLRSFESKADEMRLVKFKEFCASLDVSLTKLIS